MWRVYTKDVPVNILRPSLSIKKGSEFSLDCEQNKMVSYFVTVKREKDIPIKFEVTQTTWYKLANSSK
jgi:hypothetical protein